MGIVIYMQGQLDPIKLEDVEFSEAVTKLNNAMAQGFNFTIMRGANEGEPGVAVGNPNIVSIYETDEDGDPIL